MHIALDTSFPDSDEATALSEALGDRESWRYVAYLWIEQMKALNEKGLLKVPSWKIADFARWRGDPDEFVDAMIGCGLLKKRPSGGLYMSGWSRNRKFFKERRRLAAKQKRYRDRNRGGDVTGNGGVTLRGSPSPSRSPSRSPSHTEITEIRQLEEWGSPLFGAGITGSQASQWSPRLPIYPHELEALARHKGKPWNYAIKALDGYRQSVAEAQSAPKGQPNAPVKMSSRERAHRDSIDEIFAEAGETPTEADYGPYARNTG